MKTETQLEFVHYRVWLCNHSVCYGFQGDQYVYMLKQGQIENGNVQVEDLDGFGPYEVSPSQPTQQLQI